MAVIEVTKRGLLLRETAPGISAADVQEATEATLAVADDLHEMQLGG